MTTTTQGAPSAHILRRFAKDFNIPLPVCDPMGVDHYIDLLDDVYDARRRYTMFLDLWTRLGGDEPFFVYGADVQRRALELVKTSPAYDQFIHDTRDLFSGHRWLADNVPKGQVYKAVNDGRRFLSIDLAKANYQALRFYTRTILSHAPAADDLILGTSTFDEFIHRFTDEPYFAEAKKFRQVIFGNMNPKRQQKIQKFIIDGVLRFLFDGGWFTEADLRDYTSDEAVFVLNDDVDLDGVCAALRGLAAERGIDLHLDVYTLRWLRRAGDRLEGGDKLFARAFTDGRVDLKGVEATLVAQVCRHLRGEAPDERDLLFTAPNGLLARYVTPIEWA